MRKDLKRTLSKNKPKLYLASRSPRRTEILNKLGIDHDVIPNLLEDESLFFNTRQSLNTAVRRLCKAKAEASKENNKGLILTMDTVVFLDKKVFGKPTDNAHAKLMLNELSGQEHAVMTGICLCDTREDTPKFTGKTDTAYVKFKELSDVEIDNYIKEHDVLDKAESYLSRCKKYIC